MSTAEQTTSQPQPDAAEASELQLSVVIPCLNEAESIELVLEISVRATEDRLSPELYAAGNEEDEIPGPDAAPVHARLWVADADGLVSMLATEPVIVPPDGLRAPYHLEVDLPTRQPPWRVVGIELLVNPPKPDGFAFQPWAYDYDIGLAALRTDRDPSEVGLGAPDQWRLTRLDSGVNAGPELIGSPTSRPGLRLDSRGLSWSGLVHVRFTRVERDDSPLEVTATTTALDRFGLEIGDQASLRVFGTALPVDIVDSVAAVPGTSAADAMTADLTALTATMLAAGVSVPAVNHVWIDATPEALAEGSAATGVAEVAGEHAQVLDRSLLEEELRGDVITRLSLVTHYCPTTTEPFWFRFHPRHRHAVSFEGKAQRERDVRAAD